MALPKMVGPLQRSSVVLVYGIVLLFGLAATTQGLAISYCSPDNNAGSYAAYYNEYQSNGACQDHCQGAYAFAILQGNDCWCSNYIPDDQVNTLDCNDPCPGFQSEWCGSPSAGLYGYYQLSGGQPLGTSGGTSASAASTSASSTPASATTSSYSSYSSSYSSSIRTTTSSVVYSASPAPTTTSADAPSSTKAPGTTTLISTTTVPAPTPSSSDPPTSAMSSSPLSSSSPMPTAVYTSVTTVTGQVRTVVVTPSPTTSADATLGQSSTAGGHGVSTGKVVGIVVGVALGLGALIGLGVWFWLRRRHQQRMRNMSPEGSFTTAAVGTPPNNIPSRQVSQLSSAGLLGKTPRIVTGGIVPGNDPRSADTMSSNFDRRSMATDQRLNPHAIFMHDEGRISGISLQDNHDYSRQLRVANPDF